MWSSQKAIYKSNQNHSISKYSLPPPWSNPKFSGLPGWPELKHHFEGLICLTLLSTATIVTKALAFFTEILRMFLGLIGYVEAVGLVQRSLLMRIHVYVTLNALLPSICPAVAAHPLSLAQGAFEFSETSFLPLVWSEALAFWSGLGTIFDIMALAEAKVA